MRLKSKIIYLGVKMDIRIKKTENSIINAFLRLRAKKPLERITIKELTDLAQINKSTFYLHYNDIYDLSEQLENELFVSVFNSIAHPDSVFSDPRLFIRELTEGFAANKSLIDIIFANGRRNILADKFENEVRKFIFEKYPQYRNIPTISILLTYIIKGGYYAYTENYDYDTDTVINIIGEMAEGAVEKLK